MLDPKQVRKILVINLAFIGDVLLASPVTRALKEAFPDAEVDMLVVPVTVPIAERNPFVLRAFTYDKRGQHKRISELWKLIKKLRAESYDLTVSMNFSLRSAIIAWATGARWRVGYDAQGGGWLLTHIAAPDRTQIRHETENHLSVLRSIGVDTSDTSLALTVFPSDLKTLRTKIDLDSGDHKPIVLICPIGSYPQKSLPLDKYSQIIKDITPDCRCFLIGAAKEKDELDQINRGADMRARVLAGTLHLGELAALIKEADLLITVDTGPMHMAQAVNTPVIAFFGPTDPQIWGPRKEQDVIFYTGTECSPCWGRANCSHIKCMTSINVDNLAEIALAKINKVRVDG